MRDCLSGETNGEKSRRVQDQHPGQGSLSGESDVDEKVSVLSLAMRTDPLALIRGATEFVTVIYGPAVTFAFPDVKVEA